MLVTSQLPIQPQKSLIVFKRALVPPPFWKTPRDPWMITIHFASYSFWNRFFYDCTCYVYRWRKESSTKPALPIH